MVVMIAIKGLFSAHNEVRRPKPSTFGEDHKLYCRTENNHRKEKDRGQGQQWPCLFRYDVNGDYITLLTYKLTTHPAVMG